MGQSICFFIGSISGKGGTEKACIGLANYLVTVGYNVSILSLYDGKSPFFQLKSSVKLFEIFPQNQSFRRHTPYIVRQVRKYVAENQIDILVSVETILCAYSVPALFFVKKTKHIAWEHFNYEANFGLLIRKVARQLAAIFCDKIIVLTNRDRSLWHKNTLAKNKLLCIPNVAFPKEITSNNYELREHLVIAVGRLTYQKGFDMLLNAWNNIAEKVGDWKLLIIGSGEDAKKLEEYICKNNLSKSAKIIAATAEIDSYYNRASIFCLSSRFEGLPMVLIEAQQFGLPIVAFDCNTGPAEVVDDKVNGILCKPNDISSLCDGLMTCIDNQNLRLSYSKQAYASANKFDKDVIYATWLKLLTNFK
jgi:glycosyltransferase involved in cell wall biosynthesis